MVNKYEEDLIKYNKTKKKVINKIFDCYREMYRESEPSADFDLLCETDEVNNEFWFNNYYLPEQKFKEIHDKHCKYMRKYDKSIYDFEVYLGCSPSTNSLLVK